MGIRGAFSTRGDATTSSNEANMKYSKAKRAVETAQSNYEKEGTADRSMQLARAREELEKAEKALKNAD
jgi:hypothetical protein